MNDKFNPLHLSQLKNMLDPGLIYGEIQRRGAALFFPLIFWHSETSYCPNIIFGLVSASPAGGRFTCPNPEDLAFLFPTFIFFIYTFLFFRIRLNLFRSMLQVTHL